jgi:hypothetical protein
MLPSTLCLDTYSTPYLQCNILMSETSILGLWALHVLSNCAFKSLSCFVGLETSTIASKTQVRALTRPVSFGPN